MLIVRTIVRIFINLEVFLRILDRLALVVSILIGSIGLATTLREFIAGRDFVNVFVFSSIFFLLALNYYSYIKRNRSDDESD